MDRLYNFSVGPAMLPKEVIDRAAQEFSNYHGCGMSVAEINRTSAEYAEIVSSAESRLRALMNIPQGYKVLFIGGSSEIQYSAIPLNMLSDHKCADYVITGRLSKNASLEAKKYGDIAIAASSAGATPAYSTVPETQRKHFRPDADYVHITMNNSVCGTKFHYVPDTGNIPLVADMTSFMLSEPVDMSKFALAYANAECGIGISGLTVVILRDDIYAASKRDVPAHLNYKNASNTAEFGLAPASVMSIYMFGLMLEWIESVGGLEEIKRRNERKASLIYDYLDSQTYYTAPVDKKCRSMMNVVFVTGDAALDKKFAEEAREAGLINLSGDSSVGGMCASIYDGMPSEGVEKLVSFMKSFAQMNIKLDT